MKKRYLVFMAALLTMLFVASAYPVDYPDNCAVCGMKVKKEDKKFSARNIVESLPNSFDDIGCAFMQKKRLCAMDQIEFDNSSIAYDYYTEEEVTMFDAFYVIDSGIKTPMNYDIVAFKDKKSAEKFVAERGKGRIIKFAEAEKIEFDKKKM